MMKALQLACITLTVDAFLPGFATRQSFERLVPEASRSRLEAALTPIGPFCPFRSPAVNSLEDGMEELSELSPEISTVLTRVQLELQMSSTPDKTTLVEAADSVEQAVDKWEGIVTRIRLSTDFQSREYAKFVLAHFDDCGQNVEQVAAGMKWQAACMRAVANNEMPPPPPSNLEIEKMMAMDESRVPSMSALSDRVQVEADPFSEEDEIFESQTVKDEFKKLCKDHMQLIEIGINYGDFDPLGKIAFLDEIAKVQERWQIFFARFELLHALNQKYVNQCENFLQTMGLTGEDFQRLLKKAHDMMRQDAENERNQHSF